MKVLAIDCTAKTVSAALSENGKLISESFLNVQLTHSETLMPMVEQLLSNSRQALKDIDAFAITAGPGSFTGVRIGVSAVKGLAFGDNKPVFSYSALDAMALAFEGIEGFSGIICCLMDARCNQFYNAIFKIENGKISKIQEDRIIVANDLEKELKRLYNESNIVYVGDGARLFYSLLTEPFGFVASEHMLYQKATSIAINASKKDVEEALSPELLVPIYLRKSQAEREKEKTLS